MPGSARSRYTTFLVAQTREHGDGRTGAPVVYAVMTRSAGDALAAVRARAETACDLAIVGSLSTRTAKALKLKPQEVRAV